MLPSRLTAYKNGRLFCLDHSLGCPEFNLINIEDYLILFLSWVVNIRFEIARSRAEGWCGFAGLA